ncbi:MAG: YitT family protein [Bacilli bacterium]|nr:YitT family protein [Bacilli bacterium]MBR3162018.1 YitT family protein [Bacilli bacterium]
MRKICDLFNWDFKDLVRVLLGSFLFCFAVNFFVVPNKLYTGGILGLSEILRSIIIEVFKIKTTFDFSGIIYYLINIPLFVFAYKRVGKTFFCRTLFAVSVQTVMLSLLPTERLVDDTLTNVVVGGLLGGLGVGITLSSGASTGGTDIVGLALAKRDNHFSVGKLGLFINVFIYAIAGLRYGLEIMIYSIIYSAVDSLMIDKMHEQNICSTAFIFCKENPKMINDFIKNDLNRDFTYWYAKGGYSDTRTYIIYTALTKYELIKLERNMKKLNIQTFMVKSEGIGIRGQFEKNFNK